MKVYYAHSVALFGSPQEIRDVAMLESMGFEVLNPNDPEHTRGYNSQGMRYFTGVVMTCDALAFRANPDGSIQAGIAHEIDIALGEHGMVFELPSNMLRRRLSIDQSRAYLREQGER